MILLFKDNRDDILIQEAVKLCENMEELDSTFGFFGVSEYAKRTNILNGIMNVSGYAINNYPEAKQKYELAAQAFIKGSWKEAKKSAMAAKILEALVGLGI